MANSRNSGFTLPETVVVMVLIAVIMVGGLDFLSLVRTIQHKQELRVTATYIAAGQIEDLKAKRSRNDSWGEWAWVTDPDIGKGGHPQPSENIRNNLPEGFSVSYAIEDKTWDGTAAGSQPDYKEVTVRCLYGAPQRELTLKGYIYH